MIIFVQTQTGKTIYINCLANWTVQQLKKELQKKQEIPPDQQRIIFAGKSLQNGRILADYSIQNQSILFMVLRLRGGGYEFSFNSLESKQKVKFSDKAPRYRIVSPGLNLLAICLNKNCQAYNKKVWIQKGFGFFNMGKQMNKCKCPICNSATAPATNIGYYRTFIKIQGKQKDKQPFEIEQKVQQDELTTFVQNDQNMRIWEYLEITTQALKN